MKRLEPESREHGVPDDFETAWEEAAAPDCGGGVTCDTDALATVVWHERYRQEPSDRLLLLASALRPRALYLLTDPAGVPFVQDGLRHGEAVREAMTGRFEDLLRERGLPYLRVRGSRHERLETGLRSIEQAKHAL